MALLVDHPITMIKLVQQRLSLKRKSTNIGFLARPKVNPILSLSLFGTSSNHPSGTRSKCPSSRGRKIRTTQRSKRRNPFNSLVQTTTTAPEVQIGQSFATAFTTIKWNRSRKFEAAKCKRVSPCQIIMSCIAVWVSRSWHCIPEQLPHYAT